MLSCERAAELASEGLDRRLTIRERMSLQFHLAMCTLCRRYSRQIGLLRRAAARLHARHDIRLSAEARERIRGRVEAALL